jgi:hypothetical protein
MFHYIYLHAYVSTFQSCLWMDRLYLNKIESAENAVHVYENVFMQISEWVIIL